MTAIQPFTFADQAVRVVTDEAGEPWFVAADVARILGYRISPDMTRVMDEDERGTQTVRTPGGDQEMAVITEAGLYGVIVRRQAGYVDDVEMRAKVKAFQRWVTHEVLPSIRRTGSYATAPASNLPDITTPAGLLFLTEKFAETARALVASEAKIAELEPRAEVADKLLNADGDVSVGNAAKILTRAGVKVGQDRLFKLLASWKWVFRGANGRWQVHQRVIETGYMSVINQSHYHPRSGVLVLDDPQPRVTPKGIHKLLREHGAGEVDAVQLMFGEQP